MFLAVALRSTRFFAAVTRFRPIFWKFVGSRLNFHYRHDDTTFITKLIFAAFEGWDLGWDVQFLSNIQKLFLLFLNVVEK